MTDQDALLKAIRDAPGEDTPRLMYADWLDENGEGAKAAFVRYNFGEDVVLQVVNRQWHVVEIPARAEFTGKDHWGVMLDALAPLVSLRHCHGRVAFRGGFIDEIRLPMTTFYAKGFAAKAFRSPITKVEIADRVPYLANGRLYWVSEHDYTAHFPDGSRLPRSIYTRLPSAVCTAAKEATDNLSAACCLYGKDKFDG